MLEEFSGILAVLATIFGSLMAFGYIPQIIKMIRRKSSADVSVTTYFIFAPGILSWLFYGISLNNMAIIISNSIGLVALVILVITYFKYKK